MNQWSIRRKRFILFIIISVLVVLIGAPVFFLFYRAPTCFDGRQNGSEVGIDCGGSCQLLCTAQSLPLISKGDPRVLELKPGIYEVVAIVENPNIAAEIQRARYTIKLFEESSPTPVHSIKSETFVPNSGDFVIFEGPMNLGGRRPVRATLEWHFDTFVWQRNTRTVKDMLVKDIVLSRGDSRPRVDATLVNNSLGRISNIELTVLVSGEDGNLLAASKTFVENLAGGSSVPIVFSWPEPFEIKEGLCGYPVDIALVIDRSGSMDDLGANPPQPLTGVKDTARYFVNQLGRNNLYSLISFANEASEPADVALGVDFETIKRVIDLISIATTSPQNTNIGAGILAAVKELNSARHRKDAGRALVLLTDGVPTVPVKAEIKNYPRTYALEAAELARRDGISIYAIGLGKDVDMDLLKMLATTTTEAYFAPSTKELNSVYNQIATKICRKNPAVINIYTRVLSDKSFLK